MMDLIMFSIALILAIYGIVDAIEYYRDKKEEKAEKEKQKEEDNQD